LPRVYAVVNQKGGVGKTTTAINVAANLPALGLRGLIVDMDPQGNTTSGLGIVRSELSSSVYNVIIDADDINEVIRPTAVAGLDILPSHVSLAGAEIELVSALSRENRLKGVIGPIAGAYDFVLIDCPPSLGQLTRSALVAADRALLVAEPTIYAVAGVQRAFEAVQHEREHNPDLQPLGVVVNRVRVRSSEHNYRINELREIFGPLVLPTVLPDRAAVQHAQGAGLPIQRWGTPGGRELTVALDVLLTRMLRSSQLRRRTPTDLAWT